MSKYAVCADIHVNRGLVSLPRLEEYYTYEEIKEGIEMWIKERKEIEEFARVSTDYTLGRTP